MSRRRRWPSLLARLALPVLFAASAAARSPGTLDERPTGTWLAEHARRIGPEPARSRHG